MSDGETFGSWQGEREEVLFEMTSPAFPTQYPHLINPELIPPDALRFMEASWRSNGFGPREAKAYLLKNVYVAGEGIIFNQALEPFAPALWPARPEMVAAARAAIQSALANNAVPQHALRAVLCRMANNRNFGHWLIEMLPKAVIARQRLGQGLGVVVHSGTRALIPTINRALELLAIPENLVIRAGEEPHFHRELVVLVGLTRHNRYFSPLSSAAVRQMAEAILPGPGHGPKIYLSRVKGVARQIINHDELLPLLEKRGFTILTPGRMSLDEQYRSFRGASMIVGTLGAELTNIVFCEPGTRVAVIAPDAMPDTFFWFLAQHLRLDYTELRTVSEGPADWPLRNRNLRVNLSNLEAVLDRIEGAP